jgi:hypothetical protein
MKKNEIKLGRKYAISYFGRPAPGNVIRPADAGKWVVILDPNESENLPLDPVSKRTFSDVPSKNILAPWERYTIDTAHDAAIRIDRERTQRIEYDAERASQAKHRAPFAAAFQGLPVPAGAFSSANFARPDVDLGDYLRETFVEGHAQGASVGWDAWEAAGQTILDLRRALLDAGGSWVPSSAPSDTGIPEVMIAEVNTPLAAVQRLAASIEEDTPAGVAPDKALG